MTIDPAFLELMPTSIDIARFTGDDAYGNHTYGLPTTHRCRIDSRVRGVGGTRATGTVATKAVTTYIIYIDWVEPPYTPQDKLTMPDGSNPKITTVTMHYDERGPHHLVISAETDRSV